jgi:hypothetical protein
VKRDEIDTWATPLVVEHGGITQVIVPGMNRVRSYDAASGQSRLGNRRPDDESDPSPVLCRRMVFLTSGFRGNSLKAIKLDGAKGDITNTPAVAWTLDRDTPYVPSPLIYDGILYFLKTNNGLLTAVDAKTGKPHYQAQRSKGRAECFGHRCAAGEDLRCRKGRRDGGDQAGPTLAGAGHQHAGRPFRCVPGTGGGTRSTSEV